MPKCVIESFPIMLVGEGISGLCVTFLKFIYLRSRKINSRFIDYNQVIFNKHKYLVIIRRCNIIRNICNMGNSMSNWNYR